MGITTHSYDLFRPKSIRKELRLRNISDPSGPLGRRKAREVPAQPNYSSLGRLEKTGHQADESGFPSSVGSQQPHQFPGTDRQFGNPQLESRGGMGKSKKDLLDLEQIELSIKVLRIGSQFRTEQKESQVLLPAVPFRRDKIFSRKKSVFPRFCPGFFWTQLATIPLTKNKKDLKEVKQI
jgi:hypothetical protein